MDTAAFHKPIDLPFSSIQCDRGNLRGDKLNLFLTHWTINFDFFNSIHIRERFVKLDLYHRFPRH